jgi:FMN phosphatase YigB (HAD superfamily)
MLIDKLMQIITPKFDSQKILNKIASYQIISFDIFDTLIKRNVQNPKDVFSLVALEYEKRTFKTLESFADKRIEAERYVRSIAKTPEITLDEIYYALVKQDLEPDAASLLMEIEIEVEVAVCCANRKIKELYTNCLQQGKRVILVSNMYLPIEVINRILEKSGYGGFEKLYLSCDIGLKKTDGRLFDFALNDLKVNPSLIVHIGDSLRNDYLSARKAGLRAILIPKRINCLQFSDLPDDCFVSRTIRAFTENNIPDTESPYYRFGYESFGLLLYGFNKWMAGSLTEKGIKDIFFFARDGYMIKKAFEIQYPDNEINTHYFYASRRSLRVPQLWINPSYEIVLQGFPLAKLLNLRTFLMNLGLEPEKYTNTLDRHGLELDTILYKKELPENRQLKAFYNEISDHVALNSKREFEQVIQYFRQENFTGEVGVVDIGWHGTFQYFIQEICHASNWRLNMHGYYIGLSPEARHGIEIAGYAVDGPDENKYRCERYKAFVGLVESLFLAQDGSTERFEMQVDGFVKPVLLPYEYAAENGEPEREAVCVADIQRGALDFIRDFCKAKPINELPFDPYTAFRSILRIGTKPNKHELELFSDFRYLAERVDYLMNPKSLFYYLFHTKALKTDLALARWKIGFMKKLLKAPLPYESMYSFFRKKL